MKRVLTSLLIILIGFPIILGGILGVSYASTGQESVPSPVLKVQGMTVEPDGYEWYAPVFAGMMYKDFSEDSSLEPMDLGVMEEPQLTIKPPSGYINNAVLTREGVPVWEGLAEELQDFNFMDNGNYLLEMESKRVSTDGGGYGSFQFRAAFRVIVEPRIEISSVAVPQGDVLAVRVYNLMGGTVPVGDCVLSDVVFTRSGSGQMTAYIPVSYDCPTKEYTLTVDAGERHWTFSFVVTMTLFHEQNMTIDVYDPEISEANSRAAYEEYREKIPPLWEDYGTERYWSGVFLQPAAGDLSTEYGMARYTNGSRTPDVHTGIDIDANKGDTVIAPNAGRVVLAEYLLNTGYTLVIEHGGGLKSFFYHMDSLSVKQGDIVGRGQKVGEVGSTGYSTGPHLHYEVRIGPESIDPVRLFSLSGGMMFFEKTEDPLAEEG